MHPWVPIKEDAVRLCMTSVYCLRYVQCIVNRADKSCNGRTIAGGWTSLFDGTHDRYCHHISDFLKIDKSSESTVEVTDVFYGFLLLLFKKFFSSWDRLRYNLQLTSVTIVMVNVSEDWEDRCRCSFKPLSKKGMKVTIINVTTYGSTCNTSAVYELLLKYLTKDLNDIQKC